VARKKILYLYQYFRHPGEPGGTRAYWISKELISCGYDVTMITQRNSFNKENKDAKFIERKDIDGINVLYIRNSFANEMGVLRKIISFLSFMVVSTWLGLKQKDISLVISTSTPLSIGFPALILKFLKGVRYVFEVRDLWPEGPVQEGLIRNKRFIGFLKWFEKKVYRNAIHVVALSPGMADGVIKYIPAERVSIISNMAKIDKFWPREASVEICRTFKLDENSFKAIHFGQMGMSNDLHYIVDAAKLCLEAGYTDIEFIFMGSGKVKEEIRKRVAEEKLTNIRIIDRQPMKMVSEIVNLSDVSLVTFANLPILYTNSPNKLFDSLSAGKPIIVNSAGWTKTMVEENQCGLFVEPGNPADLVSKILLLKNDHVLRATMGQNARILAEQKYDKSILCAEYVRLVDRLIDNQHVNINKA